MVNLFAFRATDPRSLLVAEDAVGPNNDEVISSELKRTDLVVAAWGNGGALNDRASEIRTLLARIGSDVQHFGLNQTGEPRHPLYVSSGAVLSSMTV